jgi:thiamine-phosphate pyrophosphorylase
MNPQQPHQRLYIVTPRLEDPAAFAGELEAILATTDIAAVLLRLIEADERTLINRAKAVAGIVQRRDVALLLDGHPELVARVGADGAHLTGIETFAAALATLKPERIAGAGGLRSRHDAMLAAENGADYVMFGDSDRQLGRDDRRPPFEEVQERLEWWAELIELPCVGYAASIDEIEALARTGADFIALGEWIWTEPEGAAQAVKAAAEIIAAAASR